MRNFHDLFFMPAFLLTYISIAGFINYVIWFAHPNLPPAVALAKFFGAL